MWKLLKISQQTYFIYCNFLNAKQEISFIFYDLEATWSQTITLQDVKQKVKLLNRRFDFSEDNIKETLTSNAIEAAVFEGPINQDSRTLKFRYRVKNCLLNYEWTLKKQSSIEFQQTFVQPLLLALLGCHEQVEILADSIRRKDIELKQFRMEGAVLNRKTLVTKPFNFEDFNNKFEDCNKTAINFKELAKYIQENEWKEKAEIKNKNVKNVEKSNIEQGTTPKMNPSQKKRKAIELKMQHLQEHLKLRKQGLEYESSQSQTQSSGDNSQTVAETDIKYTKHKKPEEEDEKAEIESISSSRRSSRSTTANQKKYIISSEDSAEQDNEDNFSSSRKRKRTSSLFNSPKDCSTNFDNKQKTRANSKNVASEETKQKAIKSLNRLNNSRMTSPVKSDDRLNIFKFTNDSEDDFPLSEINSLCKKKNEKGIPNLKEKKFTNNFILSFNNDCGSINSISPTIGHESLDTNMISPDQPSLSKSSTPVIINEISSQLDNIKKELETLEAMRLADLKKRTCKS